jgi:hypothetical protein
VERPEGPIQLELVVEEEITKWTPKEGRVTICIKDPRMIMKNKIGIFFSTATSIGFHCWPPSPSSGTEQLGRESMKNTAENP